ncbi:MAG: hypothetical protein ACFFCM_13080, partial [Promethearchaeota archaeon]
ISIILLGTDILIFSIIYFILVLPNLICAAVYIYEYSGHDMNDETDYKRFILYFLAFFIPGLSIIFILKYQDFEMNTLRTMGFSALFFITSIIALVLSYPANPSFYFIDVFLNPSKNLTIFSVVYAINSIFYLISCLCESK